MDGESGEAAQWFEALASFSPAAAFIRDTHGRYLWVNAAYAHLYHRSPREMMGRVVEEVDPSADATTARALDREVLESRKPVRHVITFVQADGSQGKAIGHRFALDGHRGPRVGGIYVDVTGHARAQAENDAAQEELHALRERAGLAVVTLDLDGRVRRANTGAAELVGWSPPALEGSEAVAHLGEGLDAAALVGSWGSLVAGRVARRAGMVAVRTALGTTRIVRTDLALVQRSGVPDRVLAVLKPIGAETPARPRITPTQLRVLTLMAGGEPNTAVAKALGLSRQALDYHLRRLRTVLDADSRPAMVARAYATGILDPTTWPPRATAVPFDR
ncbi:PAS domain-containing protein [Streptomyces sp. NBC_00344]|uniref:PAS domain-containing protein n=1 Tax=Streptomyces sp. NBC_00344 TaxID=2975720 RepID=UPI002E1ADBEC